MESYEDLFGPKIFYRRSLGLGYFQRGRPRCAPLVVEDPYYLELLFLCHYYVILACSWDLLSGFTGNINSDMPFLSPERDIWGRVLNLNLGWLPG